PSTRNSSSFLCQERRPPSELRSLPRALLALRQLDIHEVKPMRRFLTSPIVLLAGLAVLLTGCSGESPTAPNPPGGGPGGTCNVSITLNATSVTPLAGSFVVVRATVKKNGAAV